MPNFLSLALRITEISAFKQTLLFKSYKKKGANFDWAKLQVKFRLSRQMANLFAIMCYCFYDLVSGIDLSTNFDSYLTVLILYTRTHKL